MLIQGLLLYAFWYMLSYFYNKILWVKENREAIFHNAKTNTIRIIQKGIYATFLETPLPIFKRLVDSDEMELTYDVNEMRMEKLPVVACTTKNGIPFRYSLWVTWQIGLPQEYYFKTQLNRAWIVNRIHSHSNQELSKLAIEDGIDLDDLSKSILTACNEDKELKGFTFTKIVVDSEHQPNVLQQTESSERVVLGTKETIEKNMELIDSLLKRSFDPDQIITIMEKRLLFK